MSYLSQRLSRIRGILTAHSPTSPLDGILIIAGSDGRRSFANAIIVKYLFFGASSYDLQDSNISSSDTIEQAFEECFFLITPHMFHIFIPYQGAKLLGEQHEPATPRTSCD